MGATGKPFVRYWLHNGFLTINKEKMSKSLGNFFTINEVLAKYPPSVVRFYLLSAHYRHPLDYNDAALEEARSAVNRIREAVVTAEKIFDLMDPAVAPPSESEPSQEVAKFEEAFTAAMDDDFNTQKALAVVFEAVADLNTWRLKLAQNPKDPALGADVAGLLNMIHRLLGVLGLDELIFVEKHGESTADAQMVDQLVELLVKVRKMARKQKQFALADAIRNELAKLGIRLQDLPTGTIWLRD